MMKKRKPTKFEILTVFPHMFDSYFKESMFKRALAKKLVAVNVHDIRDFAKDKHRKVDDSPFGGGPGMVIKIEPVYEAVRAILRNSKLETLNSKKRNPSTSLKARKERVILFSTRGKKLTSAVAKRLAICDKLILICGRYEGVDERVAKHIANEEISIGDYVLSGGELPAMVLIEAVSRYLPGFLGKYESLEEVKGSYPVYTRPPKFFPEKLRRARPESYAPKPFGKAQGKRKNWDVPKVLMSGDHKKIEEWRSRKGK